MSDVVAIQELVQRQNALKQEIAKEEQEKVFKMMEKDPELFQKIALEVQAEIKKGKSEMEKVSDVDVEKIREKLKK